MRNNVDYVENDPQSTCSWWFTVAGQAKYVSDECDEMVAILAKLFDMGKGLFIPLKIEYLLVVVREDIPVNSVFDQPSRLLSVQDREVTSVQGVTIPDLKDHIRDVNVPGNAVKSVRRMHASGKTRLVLEGRDEFIDINSTGLYEQSDYEETGAVMEPRIGFDPMEIDIVHMAIRDRNNRLIPDEPAIYHIVFRSVANIWFENTEIGHVNRNRLRNWLKQVNDSFTVKELYCTSDGYSEETLKNVVFGSD